MRMWFWFRRLPVAAALLSVCVSCAFATASAPPHYLITNDDATFSDSVSFYSVAANGFLTLKQQVLTGGSGIASGYFGTTRLAAINGASQSCVYASDAGSGNVVGIDVSTLAMSGSASGSSTDSGLANGIGLAMNSQYLYAAFTSSNTIGTFQVQPGCSLTFVNDISVAGLQGGFIEGMALSGNILVVTYGDGSIGSFNIASGTPLSNGDEQNSTAYGKSHGATYPTSVEITKDGHYALFGDTSTSTVIEVADISSGKLGATTVYTLGRAINSSNILLSPDETLLYVSNTQGDEITAASFNASTGALAVACTSGKLRGYSTHWSYLASLALGTQSGTGGVIYVAEFGATSYIGVVDVSLSAGKCQLKESTRSPVADPNSPGLLSIEAFPPRSF